MSRYSVYLDAYQKLRIYKSQNSLEFEMKALVMKPNKDDLKEALLGLFKCAT